MIWQEKFSSDIWNLAISAALVTVKLIMCKIILLYGYILSHFIPQRDQATCSTDAVQSPPLNPTANMGGPKDALRWQIHYISISRHPGIYSLLKVISLSIWLYSSVSLHIVSPFLVTGMIIITLAIPNHGRIMVLLWSVRMYGREV